MWIHLSSFLYLFISNRHMVIWIQPLLNISTAQGIATHKPHQNVLFCSVLRLWIKHSRKKVISIQSNQAQKYLLSYVRSSRVAVASTYDTVNITISTIHVRRQQVWHEDADGLWPIQSFSHI